MEWDGNLDLLALIGEAGNAYTWSCRKGSTKDAGVQEWKEGLETGFMHGLGQRTSTPNSQ